MFPLLPSSPSPSKPVSPSAQGSLPPKGSVDSVLRASEGPIPRDPKPPVTPLDRAKRLLLMLGGVIYGTYVLWLFALLVLLPSPTGELKGLLVIGQMSSLVGILVFIGVCGFGLLRISKAEVSIVRRRWSLVKLIGVVLPAIVLSGVTPFLIAREPTLPLDVSFPTRAEDMVAPLAITYTAERAVSILQKRGLRPVLFSWDYDGDGKPNEETVLPVGTSVYERQGLYTPSVLVKIDGGETRLLQRRIAIPQAVFSVLPIRPVVEKPIRFSIAHLLKEGTALKEAQWDFDGDGTADETTLSPDVIHTFYAKERVRISVMYMLQDRTQAKVERMVEIFDPIPPPFPVTLITEPKNLIGPAPFPAIFRIDTEEPLREVYWNFGDNKEDRGPDLRRVSHAYNSPSIYPVMVKVRSSSGKIAELTTLVRVTPSLSLPDLHFDGSPRVEGNVIRSEVPATIDLTAKTSMPLVDFFWEAPNASNAHSTGARIQAIYRDEGTYTITLIGTDAEGRVLRLPITVEVRPPAPALTFTMKPPGGSAPLRVVFDASETFIPQGSEVAGFEWSFGDVGSTSDRELGGARIEHVYEKAGEYTVTLSVLMDDGKEYSSKKTIVVRRPLLDACIEASRMTGIQVGDGVRLDAVNCTTGTPASIQWDVRNVANPNLIIAQSGESVYAHVFEEAGTFVVTLTIRDAFENEDKETLTFTIEP